MTSNKTTQAYRLAKMLCETSKGLTSVDIQRKLKTTCPHKRISDVKELGIYRVIKLPTNRHNCLFAYRAERLKK